MFTDGGHWTATGENFIVLGYHGISYDSYSHANDFEDFVNTSRYDGVGDNFVDEVSRFPVGSDNDTCGVAVTWGATSSDRSYNYNYGGLDDMKSVTSHNGATYWVLGNCNPLEGPST